MRISKEICHKALEITPGKEKAPAAAKQEGALTSNHKQNLGAVMPTTKSVKSFTHSLDQSKLCDPNECIAELNNRYALAEVGGKALVIDERAETIVFLATKEFETLYRNIKIPNRNKASIPLGRYWLDHPGRRQYLNGITFDPSNAVLPGQYNLWHGFAVEPDPSKSCQRFLRHLREIICNGDAACFDYFRNWLAYLVQHPNKLPGVAICLRSTQGAGKGLMMQYLSVIFGRHYTHLTDKSQLLGQFTGHLQSAVFVFADEVHWSDTKSDTGILKGLITEPSRLMERKFCEATEVNNYVHLIMASNESLVVPAEIGDRRFFVLDVSGTKKGDNAYFNTFKNEMEHGGPEALLAHLLAIDLTGFNPAKFPKTAARVDQQVQSLDPIDAWIYELLQQGTISTPGPKKHSWPSEIEKSPLYALYCNWVSKHRRGTNPAGLGAMTKKLGIIGITPKKLSVGGRRPQGYSLPSLGILRRNFEGLLAHSIKWDPV